MNSTDYPNYQFRVKYKPRSIEDFTREIRKIASEETNDFDKLTEMKAPSKKAVGRKKKLVKDTEESMDMKPVITSEAPVIDTAVGVNAAKKMAKGRNTTVPSKKGMKEEQLDKPGKQPASGKINRKVLPAWLKKEKNKPPIPPKKPRRQ